MPASKLLTTSALLLALIMTLAPDLAEARAWRHHHRERLSLPYPISYLHNYGPGAPPGTFAYYDGPTSVLCDQGAAAYIGQNHRPHPCF
jgi:hypothetical protein